MKPVHVGLLIIAAAVGGGLLVKLTSQPAAPPVASAPTPVSVQAPAVVPAEPATKIRKPHAMPPVERQEIAANTPPPEPALAPAPEPEPAPAPVETVAPPAPAPPPPPPQVTLKAGTSIAVRITEKLSSEHNQTGDTFTGTLDQPLAADGFVIAERGARVEGRVVNATRAGRVSGLSELSIELVQVKTSDGQRVRIETESYLKRGETSRREDAAKVGAGAALGAIIGAVAGGGKGAAIGAGAGGAAGTGTVMATRGKAAELPPESKVSFRLRNAVTVTERAQTR